MIELYLVKYCLLIGAISKLIPKLIHQVGILKNFENGLSLDRETT